MASQFVAVRNAPLAAQVADHLKDRVAQGEWAVGTRIPGENSLAAEFEVSRGTIREAVRALTMTGMFEPRVGDGTYVRARDEMSALLVQEVPGEQALGYALEFREILDTAAARSAAQAATRQDIRAMKSALSRRKKANAALAVDAYIEADAAFHRAVVVASKNPILVRVFDAIAEIIVDAIRQTVHLPADPRLESTHVQLMKAIERGDAADAGDAARELYHRVRTEHDEYSRRP